MQRRQKKYISHSLFFFSQRHNVYFESFGPIYSKLDDTAGYALGRGYHVVDKSLLYGCGFL